MTEPVVPSDPAAKPDAAGDDLVVVLHAYTGSPRGMSHVANAVSTRFPGAELMLPDLPLGLLSFANPNAIVVELIERIESRWRAKQGANGGNGYRRIIIVGYSLGGLLARKLYVVACGEDPRAPLEAEFQHRTGYEWAYRVERIVLLAGMNRGWRISHHLNMGRAVFWWLGTMAGALFAAVSGKQPVIFSVRRGAPFITQLRIQWIRMRQKAEPSGDHAGRQPAGRALTVQLLGSIDDFVAPTDNIDLVSGGDFAYLDVPASGHVSVVRMDDTPEGQCRRRVFEFALTACQAALEAASMLPQDDPRASTDYAKTNVVFVVHGIRDEGYWTHKIARKVLERARKDDRLGEFATETNSYGYFPMLPFLLSWRRQEKVEWLMDQYADKIARYPNASFHYVGHSNGTYCLARALELYPCCRFDRVVFAGSVVRRSFDWSRFLPGETPSSVQPQVRSVLNYVASADWVVAGFPKLFEHLHSVNRDLGGAGHEGFAAAGHTPFLSEVRFVRGGHGAAIKEVNWDSVADYVYSGVVAPPAPDDERTSPRRNPLVLAIGAFPPLAWLSAAIVALVVGWAVGCATFAVGRPGIALLEAVTPSTISAYFVNLDKVGATALALALVAALATIRKGLMKL